MESHRLFLRRDQGALDEEFVLAFCIQWGLLSKGLKHN